MSTTAGKALALLAPLREGFAPANSTVWVFEATGRFQEGGGSVANPPTLSEVWALVVKGKPGVLSEAGTAPLDLQSLGPASDLPLSALDSGQQGILPELRARRCSRPPERPPAAPRFRSSPDLTHQPLCDLIGRPGLTFPPVSDFFRTRYPRRRVPYAW